MTEIAGVEMFDHRAEAANAFLKEIFGGGNGSGCGKAPDLLRKAGDSEG